MKKVFKSVGIGAIALASVLSSCKKEQSSNRDLSAGALQVTPHIPTNSAGAIIDNDGTADNVLDLSSSSVWLLDSITRVPSGMTIRIPAGTTIKTGTARTYTATNPLDPSQTVTRDIAGVLLIDKGGKIDAQGTNGNPIVFTTASGPGVGTAGTGCSVIILGNANINASTLPQVEGLPTAPSPYTNTYGTSNSTVNDNENSGIMSYVRIEYPGVRLFQDQEVNGLTFGGVGRCTQIDHIQVSYSADDAFEWFGGTVNARYLIALGSDDDDYDFDLGYSGAIQFAIALKNTATTHSTSGGSSDSNGIESDNNAAGTSATPVTRPILSNFTVLGYNPNTNAAQLEKAVHFRRNSSFAVSNSIFGGFTTGVDFESPSLGIPANFVNNVVHGFTNQFTGVYTPAGNFGGVSPTANTLTRFLSPNAFFVNPLPAYNPASLGPAALSFANGSAQFNSGSLWDTTVNRGSATCPFFLIPTFNIGAIDVAAVWNFSGFASFPAY